MTIILSVLLFLTLATSCTSDDSYLKDTPEITFTEDTPKEQIISAETTEAPHDISFTTNYTWRVNIYERTTKNIENETDWLHISQLGGSRGTFDLKITTKENTTYEDRKAEIVISCDDNYSFTLIQKGKTNEV